jgi:predicted deacylase
MTSIDGLVAGYATRRDRFRAAVRRVGATFDEHPIAARGPSGEELTADVARIGPADAPARVLVVSGVHGVEGHAGSLLQSRWLESAAPAALPAGLSVVLLHAANPHGFAWDRRVNEDNVDLNRNFVDFDDPPSNEDYEELADALCPGDWSEETQAATEAAILDWATNHGFDAVQAAISSGQYRHPDGLFYGGTAPVRSQEILRDVVTSHLTGAERVAVLDLHTGLGKWGEVELITHELPGSEAYDRSVSWWGGRVASTEGGGSVSAALHGEWMPAAAELIGPAEVTAVALEWGTVDSISVVQALRADNWLHVHGDPTGPDAPAIKARLRAAFAPEDPEWFATIEASFLEVVEQTLNALT